MTNKKRHEFVKHYGERKLHMECFKKTKHKLMKLVYWETQYRKTDDTKLKKMKKLCKKSDIRK